MATKLVRSIPIVRTGAVALMPRNGLNLVPRRNFLPSRYDPFEEMHKNMNRMIREFDRFFPSPSFWRPPPVFGLSRATTLPIEKYDKGKGLLTIEVDLPDFKPEDIQVTVKEGQLEIVAKSESTGDAKEFRELRYRYSLPEKAEIDNVRSLLKSDGRLVIEAPLPEIEAKTEEQAVDKEIPVKKL